MSRNGFNRKEPIEVPIDKPQCFKDGYLIFKNDLLFEDEDFVNSMSLPTDILNEIFYYDRVVTLKVLKN